MTDGRAEWVKREKNKRSKGQEARDNKNAKQELSPSILVDLDFISPAFEYIYVQQLNNKKKKETKTFTHIYDSLTDEK